MPLRNLQITLRSDAVRPGASGIECGGVRTVVEVWDYLQDMAIGVESFWPTDSTREVPVRGRNGLGINEVAGGDSLVESLTKRNGGDHVCRLSGTGIFCCPSFSYDQRPDSDQGDSERLISIHRKKKKNALFCTYFSLFSRFSNFYKLCLRLL